MAGISLDGFDDFREMEMGRGSLCLVIRGRWQSALLLFDSDESLIDVKAIGHPESVTLLDFDGDGTDEMLIDESDGHAVGEQVRHLRLYRLSDGGVKTLWEGESVRIQTDLATGKKTVERYCSIRPTRDGFWYSCFEARSLTVLKQFLWTGGTFREAPPANTTRSRQRNKD